MKKTSKKIVLTIGLVVALAGLLLMNYTRNYYHFGDLLTEEEYRFHVIEQHVFDVTPQYIVVSMRPYFTYGSLLLFIGLILLGLPQLYYRE